MLHRSFSSPCILFLLTCVVLIDPRFVFAAPDRLTYTTPSGVTFEVTAAGLSSIRYHDRQFASGGWSFFNGDSWFKEFKGLPEPVSVPEKFTEQSIAVTNDRVARVRRAGGDVICTIDYSFEGEDLTCTARIENQNEKSPINVAGFSGLTFHFTAPPHGQMPTQHSSYFQAHGIRLCHPGEWQRIGGSWAADEELGVGTSPWNTGLTRTLTLWDYRSWEPDKRERLPDRLLIYFIVSPIPARGAATFDMKLRVSPDRDWKHLLEPYRAHFQRTFGPVQYKADFRWIATDYLNHSIAAISPENPYGFHGGHRRIDTAAGAAAFCNTVLEGLRAGNGQGVIVWGQGGEDPRGAMYRPDFDILPGPVEANWALSAKRFHEAGRKIGVATRPRHIAVRADAKEDQIIDINPDDEGHREMLWRRFKNMTGRGCTLFYLDSFGDSFEDVKLMRFLRTRLGPEILTFAEHQCDAIFPYSGGYSETTFEPAQGSGPPSYRLWSGQTEWEVYQWLAPGSQMAARLYEVKGKIPADFEPIDHYFLGHGIMPLVFVDDFSRAPALKSFQESFKSSTRP